MSCYCLKNRNMLTASETWAVYQCSINLHASQLMVYSLHSDEYRLSLQRYDCSLFHLLLLLLLLIKISPVGDWRSTSLDWRFSILDPWIGSWPWPWRWIRPYGIPSCITRRPLPTYQISLRSEEKIFEGHHWGFGQVQSHVTQKLGQI